jgi:hypothetical protein
VSCASASALVITVTSGLYAFEISLPLQGLHLVVGIKCFPEAVRKEVRTCIWQSSTEGVAPNPEEDRP